jgi:hypothetical protein
MSQKLELQKTNRRGRATKKFPREETRKNQKFSRRHEKKNKKLFFRHSKHNGKVMSQKMLGLIEPSSTVSVSLIEADKRRFRARNDLRLKSAPFSGATFKTSTALQGCSPASDLINFHKVIKTSSALELANPIRLAPPW